MSINQEFKDMMEADASRDDNDIKYSDLVDCTKDELIYMILRIQEKINDKLKGL